MNRVAMFVGKARSDSPPTYYILLKGRTTGSHSFFGFTPTIQGINADCDFSGWDQYRI